MNGDMSIVQSGENQILKLVNITPIIMVYGTYNWSYWDLYTNL